MTNFFRLSGLTGAIICIVAYFIFSSINHDYYHLTKAFSELSSIGQPNIILFATFGFLIPGMLAALFFILLRQWVNDGKGAVYPFIFLSLSGVLIALGASPMDYSNFDATTSRLHIIGAMGSGLLFLIGAFTVTRQLKKDPKWKSLNQPLLILVYILIVSAFFRTSDFPGLAQKIGILAYYVYIAILSWRAYSIYKNKAAVPQ